VDPDSDPDPQHCNKDHRHNLYWTAFAEFTPVLLCVSTSADYGILSSQH
jgi:hypothetical protein